MKSEKPDEVIIAAAKVGGIHANNTYPAEFIYQNLQIQQYYTRCACERCAKITLSGIFVYLSTRSRTAMYEDALLTEYSSPLMNPMRSQRSLGSKCESYNRQAEIIVQLCQRTYRPGDNYHTENSHVVPALIRRFHEAKEKDLDEGVVWGSGTPMREFLYVDDMAEASLFVHELDPETLRGVTQPMLSHINVGTGTDVTIKELAETISEVIGFKGVVVFDPTKPDGTPRKLWMLSASNLGWQACVSLKLGIERSYADFLAAHSGENRL